MTTFDLCMIPLWLFLASCLGMWIWLITSWICFEINDRMDRQDSELQSTKVFPYQRETAGLDTQLAKLRGIGHVRDYRSLQCLNATEDYVSKGEMTDRELLTVNLVGTEPISATELRDRYRIQNTPKTVSAALLAGYKAGMLEKQWVHRRPFGYYLYRKTGS